MAISRQRIDRCLATVEAIISSKDVDQYLIGFTRKSANQKGDDYRRAGFEHFVILADKMDRASALKLENELQRRTLGGPTSSRLHRKYHQEKVAKRTLFSSAGGSPADGSVKECSVYLAWWMKQITAG